MPSPASNAWQLDWADALTAGVIAVDLALLGGTRFALVPAGEWPIAAGLAVLGVLTVIYGRFRPRPILASTAAIGFRYVLFTNAAAVLSYLLTGLVVRPRIDAWLDGADQALGLSWHALNEILHATPDLAAGVSLLYLSLSVELLVLIVLHGLYRQNGHARVLFRAFVVTALATIGIGVWLPAAGVFVHDHLPIAAHTGYVAQMQALRDGTLLRIDLRHAEGLVVFPSFHAALALLLAWGAGGLRRLRWGFWIWSGAIVLVTPSEGGHYFVDVFAGIVLALVVILAVRTRASSVDARPAAVAAR